MNIVYIPEISLFVCNTEFGLQYEIRINTDRTTIPTRIFLDLMVTNWLKPSERLICTYYKLKDVSYLHYKFCQQGILISLRSFYATEIISRDHIVEIKKQTMVRNFRKFRKRMDYRKRSQTWSVPRVVSLCFCHVSLLLIHFYWFSYEHFV